MKEMGPLISQHEVNFHEYANGETAGTRPDPSTAYAIQVRNPGEETHKREGDFYPNFEGALRACCVLCDKWEEDGVEDGDVIIIQSIVTDIAHFWPKTAVKVIPNESN